MGAPWGLGGAWAMGVPGADAAPPARDLEEPEEEGTHRRLNSSCQRGHRAQPAPPDVCKGKQICKAPAPGCPQPLPHTHSPDVVCFSFSFFFFLHFQGLKILPRVASLLFLLTGGVRIPETRYSERTGGVWSISSGRRKHREGSAVTKPTQRPGTTVILQSLGLKRMVQAMDTLSSSIVYQPTLKCTPNRLIHLSLPVRRSWEPKFFQNQEAPERPEDARRAGLE